MLPVLSDLEHLQALISPLLLDAMQLQLKVHMVRLRLVLALLQARLML